MSRILICIACGKDVQGSPGFKEIEIPLNDPSGIDGVINTPQLGSIPARVVARDPVTRKFSGNLSLLIYACSQECLEVFLGRAPELVADSADIIRYKIEKAWEAN
jgi:hypothetical protein